MKFAIGTSVVILKSNYHKLDLIGQQGVVEYYWSNSNKYGVRLADKQNKYSKLGVWWFTESALSAAPSKEEKYMLPGYKIAHVSFPANDHIPTEREPINPIVPYALYDSEGCKEGDNVLVMSGHHGMAIAQIERIEDYVEGAVKYNREVICKLNFEAYNARQLRIEEIMKLEKAMKQKASDLQNIAIYKMLAKDSPEMQEMLDRYVALTGTHI